MTIPFWVILGLCAVILFLIFKLASAGQKILESSCVVFYCQTVVQRELGDIVFVNDEICKKISRKILSTFKYMPSPEDCRIAEEHALNCLDSNREFLKEAHQKLQQLKNDAFVTRERVNT